jgi:hypothetical protein
LFYLHDYVNRCSLTFDITSICYMHYVLHVFIPYRGKAQPIGKKNRSDEFSFFSSFKLLTGRAGEGSGTRSWHRKLLIYLNVGWPQCGCRHLQNLLPLKVWHAFFFLGYIIISVLILSLLGYFGYCCTVIGVLAVCCSNRFICC